MSNVIRQIIAVLVVCISCGTLFAQQTAEPKRPSGEVSKGVSKLAGAEWRLVRLDGKDAVAVGDGKVPTIQFDENGRAQGFGGCNRFSGSYKVEGTNLKLGPLASTKMFCAAGSEQEDSYFKALDAATTFKVKGATLKLLKDKEVLAVFKR